MGKSNNSSPSSILNVRSLILLIGFVAQISTVIGDEEEGYYDCVTPMPGIDFPGCFQDLAMADRNGDGYVKRNEYLGFIQEYGKRICWNQDELTLEQYAAFNTIACWCSTGETGTPACCLGENAEISTAGALDPDRTEAEEEYLSAVCILTDSTMVHNCTESCTFIDTGTNPDVIVPDSRVGPPVVFASDADDEDGFRFLWLLFILATLLLCCCLCCACFRKKKIEETKEVKEITETIEKPGGPMKSRDLELPFGEDEDDKEVPSEILPSESEDYDSSEVVPSEILPSEEEDQTAPSMNEDQMAPRELLASDDEDSELATDADSELAPSEILASEDENQTIPSELLPSEEEDQTIPSINEDETVPSEILPSDASEEEEEEEEGGGKDGGGDVPDEEEPEPPPPVEVEEESSEEEEEDGGRRRGGGGVDDDDDEANRRIRGAGELPPDPEPDNEGVNLKPIPDKEPPEEDEFDQPGRDINFDKDKDEMSAGEVDHYEPDGGVNIPERPTKDPIDYENKWEREEPDDPDEDDNRKHRIQAGLGEGQVWDHLDEDESLRGSTAGRASGGFDWVVKNMLGVLDDQDEEESDVSHLVEESSDMGFTSNDEGTRKSNPLD